MKISELGKIESVKVSFNLSSNYTEMVEEMVEEEDPNYKFETVEEIADYVKDVFLDNFDEGIWKEDFLSVEINGKEYGFNRGMVSELS